MSDRPFYETNRSSNIPETIKSLPLTEQPELNSCGLCGSSQKHDTCNNCNTVIHVGMWQWCKGNSSDHGFTKHYGFEPYCDEHILPGGADRSVNLYGERVQGTWIGSRSERQAIMKANGVISGGKVDRKQSSKMDFDGRAAKIAKDAIETWNKNR